MTAATALPPEAQDYSTRNLFVRVEYAPTPLVPGLAYDGAPVDNIYAQTK